jgi:cysteine-rich repeat protein
MGNYKKTAGVFFAFLFLLTLVAAYVSAYEKDVAYIVKNKYYIDSHFTDAINDLGLSYDIIYHSNLSSTNLSKYKMMLLNDDGFNNPSSVPVNNFPAVLVNGKNMADWGWCRYISRTSQTNIFHVDIVNFNTSVTKDIHITDVKIYNRIGPEIYNMQPENIFSGITLIASKKNDPNDAVIAVAGPGDILTYPGKPNTYVNAKTCFFGIFETAYWTNETKQLFRGCIGYVAITCSQNSDCDDNDLYTQDTCHYPGTVNSYCDHEPIRCFTNSDCGTDFYSNNYCSLSSDVFRDHTIFTCNNPGETSSYCTNSTQSEIVDDCVRGCSGGVCLLSHDLAFTDNYDGFGNKIKLRDPNNTNINNPAVITQKGNYDIGFKITNKGDYTESGSVTCRIQNSSNHEFFLWSSSIVNLNANENTTTGSRDNYDLSGYKNGVYIVRCNLTISSDDFPSDNYAERSFTINYPAINCTFDSDCGIDGFIGGNFCIGKNITRNYIDYTCNNPGLPSSYCSNSQTSQLIQQCADYCLNGECRDFVCENDSDCDDLNPMTYDQCINPSTPISECRNTPINCFSNDDCGFTGFLGDQYCHHDDVYKNYQSAICSFPGTLDSYCTLRVNMSFLYECEYACIPNGICIRCDENSDCNDNNSSTDDICINPGTIESYCNNEEPGCLDNDHDGYDICNPGDPGDDGNPSDCNDSNANVHPGALEVCNGIDDDCDGMIDENLGTTTCGFGVCLHTINNCVSGIPQICNPFEGASNETCNGIDDDCDGSVDEGGVCGECTPGETRNCGSDVGECEHGTQTCSAERTWGACIGGINPIPEICDNKDNDCDGLIDETFSNKGQVCSVGIGVCLRTGNYICTGNGLGTQCSVSPGAPSTEICNYMDDDCDGAVDEGLLCIRCTNSTQCGTNKWFGNSFCVGNNKSRYYLSFQCMNAGTYSSYCKNQTILHLITQCEFGCAGGVCLTSVCGNGIKEANEECDDGNTQSNDGCSATCENECSYSCNPHNCNAHECNCREICYWGVCNRVCDTCYDTCYDTCWRAC